MFSLSQLFNQARLLLASVGVFVVIIFLVNKPAVTISSWMPPLAAALAEAPGQQAAAEQIAPLSARMLPSSTGDASAQLAAYNAGSALQDSVADGRVEFYRRAVAGGEILYSVARLDEQVHVEVINADGATPGSDATGDTMWTDGQRHLVPVVTMASAPYAAREGMELLWAMAFGFHGDARTSNEGSVVINGTMHRVNAGRASLCITPDLQARIGKLDAQQLAGCQQAIGGGPVMLWEGKVADTSVASPTEDRLPFNPLGEDFVQLDWRITVYNGTYPKTAVCVGALPGGKAFLVLANSNGISGVDFASTLRDMGCHSALGGDDDTSTQAVWRGQQLWSRAQRPVPDAIAVYIRH